MWDLSFPTRGRTQVPCVGFLTTGPPGKSLALFFFFFLDFLMWASFKVFIEFVTILILFYVSGFFATRHVRS